MENATRCFSRWRHLICSNSSKFYQEMADVFYISRTEPSEGSGLIVIIFTSPTEQIQC